MRRRSAEASSSDSVRSGRLERDPEGDGLLALADLLAVVDVEDAHLAQLGHGPLRGLDELARGHVLVDGEGEVLA